MQPHPDRMRVYYEDTELFDTLCGSDEETQSIELEYGSPESTSTTIRVEVEPRCNGATEDTIWQFTVGCAHD